MLCIRKCTRTCITVVKLVSVVTAVVVGLLVMEALLKIHMNTKLQSEYKNIVSRVGREQMPQQPLPQEQAQHMVVQRQLQNIVTTQTQPVNKECPVISPDKNSNNDVQSNHGNTQPGKAKKFKSDGYLLTLFTTLVRKKVRTTVYNNTKYNWLALGKQVKPVLFTDDKSLQKEFKMAGWTVYSVPKVSKYGIPVLKNMYITARQRIKAEFYAFSNADIIYTDGLSETLEAIGSHNLSGHVYITGRRSDVKNVTRDEALSFSKLKQAEKRGELHIPFAEDYFITDKKFPWDRIPELVIGRQYYDNWMSYNARMKKYWAIDATSTVLAVHQTVDRGSFEHRILKDQKNRFYNFNLLMNKPKAKEPNFESGLTTCLEYFTTKSIYNETLIAKRQRLPDYCDLNGPRHRRIQQY